MGCGSHGPWPWKQLRRSPAANNQTSVAAVAAPSSSNNKPGSCTVQLLAPTLAYAQSRPAACPPWNAGAQANGRPPGVPHSLTARRDGEPSCNLGACLQAHSSTTSQQQQQPPEQGSHTAGLPCSAASPCHCSSHNARLACASAFCNHAAQLAMQHPAGHGQSSSTGMRLQVQAAAPCSAAAQQAPGMPSSRGRGGGRQQRPEQPTIPFPS